MATLADVRGEIKANLTVVGTEQDSSIDGYIRTSLRQQREKRYSFLRRKGILTISAGASSSALPSDFAVADFVNLIYDGRRYGLNNCFTLVSYMDFLTEFNSLVTLPIKMPSVCAINTDNEIEIDATADRELSLELVYFAKDAVLPSNDGDSSIWFDEGFDVIRASAQLLYAKFNEGDSQAPADELNAFLSRLDEKAMFNRGTGQRI